MDKMFQGKVAVVTGAGSGIGRATALAFAERGARVLVSDVSESGGKDTVRIIGEQGGEAIFQLADVSNAKDVSALMDRTVESFGRLDYAFNNAGIEGQAGNTVDCSEENWDRTLSVNLKGVWLCMKSEIPHIIKSGGGAIVNMASVAGLVGFANLPAYCASKGGVVQLTRSAALEYVDQGIRINAICPGVIETPMIERFTQGDKDARQSMALMAPINRMGSPEEIAEVVTWLCSESASFVVGHAMVADGGLVIR